MMKLTPFDVDHDDDAWFLLFFININGFCVEFLERMNWV